MEIVLQCQGLVLFALERRDNLIMKEWEKIRELKGKKRWEYLWSYYKFVLLIFLIGIMIFYVCISSFHGLTQKTLLSIVLVDMDSDSQKNADLLKKDVLDLLGQGNKKEEVKIDTSVTSLEDTESVMKLSMSLAESGDNDLVICNQTIYDKYQAEHAFQDWRKILGKSYEKYVPYINGNSMDISKSEKWRERKYVTYEPVYLCVLNSAEHMESVKAFLQFLYE